MSRWLRVLFVTVALLLAGYAGLHYWIKSQVKQQLSENLPKSWLLDYRSIGLNLFSGSIQLNDINLQIKDSLAINSFLDIEAKHFGIYDVSYSEFLEENEIYISKCRIVQPRIVFKPYARHKDSLQVKASKEKQSLQVTNIALEQGLFVLLPSETDKQGFQVEEFNVNINEFNSNVLESNEMLPFEYDSFNIDLNGISFAISPYERLEISEADVTQDSVHFSKTTLLTTLNRKEYNKQLKKERDHYDLSIPEILFDFPGLKKKNNQVLVDISKMQIKDPVFKLYRDKLLPDEYSHKSLFNEKFRNLPFILALDSLEISQADILYTEKNEYYNDGGQLKFLKMNVTGSHIGNAYSKKDTTKIVGHGLFMTDAKLDFDWRFQVYDTKDSFDFKAEVNELNAADLNVLTKNNMDIDLKGRIETCSFHIRGNHYSAYQNFKIRYHNLNIKVLNKKKGKESWIGSTLANMLVKKDSYSKGGKFRYSDGRVLRDPSKSFFNYLWLNVKDGLIDTLL